MGWPHWPESQELKAAPDADHDIDIGPVAPRGVGRDGGDWGFDSYMETKNIAVALDTHAVPKLGG